MSFFKTAERVSAQDPSDNYVFQRSLIAYSEAAGMIAGDVLEIGTGSGYGVEMMAAQAHRLVTLDRRASDVALRFTTAGGQPVEFLRMNVPPLRGLADASFDFVVSFQVIEHIEQDGYLVEEAYRVLKKGGKFIVTTPNKKMSLTRNPWHVREYMPAELQRLLGRFFQSVERWGVSGNDKVMDYYQCNKRAVQRLTRFDILNLQYRLPRKWLQLPYDVLNRINRQRLLRKNHTLTHTIGMDDYRLEKVSDTCLDLFYVAKKA